MPQQFDAGHNTILTERKSTHAMIAGRTQPARTLIALNHRRILSMVATVHHVLKTYLLTDCYGRCRPVCCQMSPFVDPPVSVPEAPRVFVPRTVKDSLRLIATVRCAQLIATRHRKHH